MTISRRLSIVAFVLAFVLVAAAGVCRAGGSEHEISPYSLAVFYLPDVSGKSATAREGGVKSTRGTLELKGVKEGTYRICTHSYSLPAGRDFEFSFNVTDKVKGKVQLSAFANDGYRKELIEKRAIPLSNGPIVFRFTTSAGEEAQAVWFLLEMPARTTIRLSSMRIVSDGPVGQLADFQSIGLEYDAKMGVYRENQPARCAVSIGTTREVGVSITDGLTGETVLEKALSGDTGYMVEVPTSRRGYYLLTVFTDEIGKRRELGSSPYVVIRKDPADGNRDSRFGLCLDEYPSKPVFPAGVSQEYLYSIYHDMGVGAVRLYSAVKPKVLSPDGEHYNFTAFEKSLGLAEKNGFQVLVPLGSGSPNKVPDWLRTDARAGNVSLTEGLVTARLKNKSKKGAKPFLDVGKYRRYLETVFEFMADRVQYVEIWNEPGHKFTPADTLRLASAAKDVKTKLGCPFLLLGYSSTKGRGTGQGSDPAKVPGFLEEVISLGGADLVDGISYHSGHAYRFLGDSHDPRNHETGYPARIRRVLERDGRSMRIWDTERGNPWNSRYADTYLSRGGSLGSNHDNYLDIRDNVTAMQAAKQLPMIYAAAMFDDIETLFWFHGNGFFAQNNSRLVHRWGLFDVLHQPSPQIASYEFMAEALGYARPVHRVDDESGLSAYVFAKGQDVVVLIYNWREAESRLSVAGYPGRLEAHDVFGRKIVGDSVLPITGAPLYLVLSGVDAESVFLEKMPDVEGPSPTFGLGLKKQHE